MNVKREMLAGYADLDASYADADPDAGYLDADSDASYPDATLFEYRLC